MNHIESFECPCNPEITKVCPECEDLDDADPDCWMCQGRGLVAASKDEDIPLIIIHQETS